MIPTSLQERLVTAIENLNQTIAEIAELNQADQYLSNEQVCEILKIAPDTLRRRIKNKTFLEGYHFTGSRADRRWSKRRLDRHLETRHDRSLEQADIKQWHRQLKGRK